MNGGLETWYSKGQFVSWRIIRKNCSHNPASEIPDDLVSFCHGSRSFVLPEIDNEICIK